MTIIGIGGCMALMLVGFGLEDSITEIAKRQYVDIFTYDASATLNTKASDAQREEFMKTVSEREGVTGTLEVCEVNVDMVNGRQTRSANLDVYKRQVFNGLFENVHFMMGMEDAMISLYEEPEAMHDFIDFLADWEIELAKEYIQYVHPDCLFRCV